MVSVCAFLQKRSINSRETQVRDDGGLVETKAGRSHSVESPDEQKHPNPLIFQSRSKLFPVEVLLDGSGCSPG